jgi:hypothetical protein
MMCLCLANEEKITPGARSPAADRGRRSSSGTDDHGGDIAHLKAGVPSTPERPVDDGDLCGHATPPRPLVCELPSPDAARAKASCSGNPTRNSGHSCRGDGKKGKKEEEIEKKKAAPPPHVALHLR